MIRSRLIGVQIKVRVYKISIRAVLTYDSETWTLTKEEVRTLASLEKKNLPMIMIAV